MVLTPSRVLFRGTSIPHSIDVALADSGNIKIVQGVVGLQVHALLPGTLLYLDYKRMHRLAAYACVPAEPISASRRCASSI